MMTNQIEIQQLQDLEFIAYLDKNGMIPEEFDKKIGVYAIFNQDKQLEFVGYSRNIYLSLKQNLVRQPELCYWIKAQTITHPNRTILEEIRQAWIEESNTVSSGKEIDEAKWSDPINAKISMTAEEKEEYQNTSELDQIKLLKNIARRVEGEIKEKLKSRGVEMDLRFNPKLKEQGLLDLK